MTAAPRILRPADWTAQPWRNGGGTTHEIAARRDGLGGLLWRLSTARVEKDGPYSAFPGLTRISTAVEGNGTTLRDPDTGRTVRIPPMTPIVLDGGIRYEGALTDGPIRHLNMIFDPARIAVRVRCDPPGSPVDASGGRQRLVFCTAGRIDGLCVHGTLWSTAPHTAIEVGPGARCIRIDIEDA